MKNWLRQHWLDFKGLREVKYLTATGEEITIWYPSGWSWMHVAQFLHEHTTSAIRYAKWDNNKTTDWDKVPSIEHVQGLKPCPVQGCGLFANHARDCMIVAGRRL